MKAKFTLQLIALVSSTALLTACATTPAPGSMAGAKLEARSDSSVRGLVAFTELPEQGGMKIFIDATGVNPGEHGFHVHEVGDCSAFDGSSAKGHFNPDGKAHGHVMSKDHHAGDMPNLLADDFGTIRTTLVIKDMTLIGENSIAGRSVILHASPDDYRSQPEGKSGKRIACGVIAVL